MRKGAYSIRKKRSSHSIAQVYIWNLQYDLAREEIRAWRAENPGNKYPVYFAPQLAMMTGDWNEAKVLLDEAIRLLPEEPLMRSLQGLFYALTGKPEQALECVGRACAIAKSFGHAHHTYYQVACIFAVLGRETAAFEWLERSVSTGFACWPFFLKDRCLREFAPSRGVRSADQLTAVKISRPSRDALVSTAAATLPLCQIFADNVGASLHKFLLAL